MRRTLRLAALAVSLCATLRLASAAPGGPVDDPGLVARARAEGNVVLYGAITAAQLTAVAARFQSTYGIATTTLRIESDKLPGRVLTELQSGSRDVDVVGDSVFQMDLLRRDGAFATFRPPEDRDLIAGAYDPAGSWSATIVNTEAIAYNPVRLRAAGIRAPQTWDDLAAKEWHGYFGLFTGSYEWFAAMKRFFGKDRGELLLRAYAANQPRLLTSKQLGISLIEAGDILGAPNLYGYDILADQRKGLPIQLVNPTPTVIEPYAVAVMKAAPHPNAARLLLRWWLTRDTQQWQKDELHRISPRKDVQNDPVLLDPKVRYMVSNPADSLDYGDVVKTFNAILGIPG